MNIGIKTENYLMFELRHKTGICLADSNHRYRDCDVSFCFGDRYKVESIPLEWVRTLSVLNLLSTHTKAVYQRVMSNTTPVIV